LKFLTVKVPVHRVSVIGCEHSGGQVVAQSDSVKSLSQTIEVVVLGQLGYKLNVLILEDQHGALGGEDNITSRLSQDGEAEGRVIGPDELKINVLGSLIGNTLLRLVDLLRRQDVPASVFRSDVSRCDLDCQTVGRLVGDGEIEDINVIAVDVAGLSCKRQSGCEAILVVHNIRCLVTRTDVLRNFGLGVLDVGKQVCTIINRSWEGVLSGETVQEGQCLGPQVLAHEEERSLRTYVERVPLTRTDAVAPDQEETRGPWSIGFVGMGSDEAVCVVV
jgi:hypothetical protein